MSSTEIEMRAGNAFKAMKAIGFNMQKVVPVLRSLLKLYEKKWEPIEDDNYRVLADALFENEKTEATKETPRPLKRLRLKYQEPSAIAESCGPPTLNASQNEGKQPSLEPSPITDNADVAVTQIRPGVVTMHHLIEQFDDQTKRLNDSLKKEALKALAAAEERAKRAEYRAKRLEEIAKKSMAIQKKAILQIEQDQIELQNSNLALEKMEKEKLAVEEKLKKVREVLDQFAEKVNSIGSSS